MSTSKPLSRHFFERGAEEVARDLLGKHIVHLVRKGSKPLRARIVETEAYIGTHDLACHAAKGRTARTEPLFGPAGFAYIYLVYGIHELFNIVVSREGDAQAVLIRAAELVSGGEISPLKGPGNFSVGMKISRAHNRVDLCQNKIYLEEGRPPKELGISRRVGVDYAKEWADKPLRFFDSESRAVSKLNRRNK